MAANQFTSVSSLIRSIQILKNPSLPACGISFSSFQPTFRSPNGASVSLGLNTRKKTGLNVRAEETQNKGMTRQMGGQWLSSTTRHVRIYAAYIDPVTEAFDQTQTDKLTLILDPTNEFIWPEDKCQKVYDYFSELVDHYEVPLLENVNYIVCQYSNLQRHILEEMASRSRLKACLHSEEKGELRVSGKGKDLDRWCEVEGSGHAKVLN